MRSTVSTPTSCRSTGRGSCSPPPPDGDLVLLASGSAAQAYAATGGRLPVVSIGGETSRVARAAGLSVVAEAASPDVDGLVAAVRDLMDSTG